MRFSTRNAFYLRASNYRVVPLFLYLDERHVDWMSDKVLQLVIADMKDKMEHLLTVEKSEKKHRVHVERGDTYQYCYFLRKTTRTEVVLLKKKTFSLRAPTPPPRVKVGPSRKRKATATLRSRSRRARLVSEGVMPDDISDDDDYDEDDEDEDYEEEVCSGEIGDDDDDVVVKDEPRDPDEVGLDELDEDQETGIKDWKPDVSLSYQGFGTTSVQLVLIIEPYPPLPPSQYAPPASRLSSRSASILSSRSRSRSQMGTGRYTSLAPGGSSSSTGSSATALPNVRNMRNATRSASVATPAPTSSSRRGGSSSRYESETPGPGGSSSSSARSRQTPLFIPRDTPFGDDEEDEEAHEAFAQALREGRWRLPSVVPRDADGGDGEDENPDDAPEGMMAIGERLVRASEIEEGVVRNSGGWEERLEGEESAVLGKEEPGD